MNSAAVTTAFTNELCTFWHFRVDANVDMKVAALLEAMNKDPKVKNVYMLNQNYAYGKSFQHAAVSMFKQRVKNGKMVGDDLMVPFGKVQDFTPFVAKIKSLNADTVLTGNWGPDLARFVQAIAGAGLDVQVYSIYGGIPSSINSYGKENGLAVHMKQITFTHDNADGRSADAVAFAKYALEKTKKSWYASNVRWAIELLANAMKKANSTDPLKVAYALEGLKFQAPLGEGIIRAKDHQILAPMVISELTSQYKNEFTYNGKGLGIAFKTTAVIPRDAITLPTTCKMKRPKKM